MPHILPPEQREAFHDLARTAGERERNAYDQRGKLLCGADVAEAPFHSVMRRVWLGLAVGMAPALVLKAADDDWRRYAEENNAKVEQAPRVRRGPSAGHSVIAHRWVSPDKVESITPHVYTMLRLITGVQ
jgi:hypothetical protein